MSDYILSSETREKLKKVSTASVATALFKRGLRNQFVQGVRPVEKKPVTMVGQAFTLRYIPAREDRNPLRPVPRVMCWSWTPARTVARRPQARS